MTDILLSFFAARVRGILHVYNESKAQQIIQDATKEFGSGLADKIAAEFKVKEKAAKLPCTSVKVKLASWYMGNTRGLPEKPLEYNLSMTTTAGQVRKLAAQDAKLPEHRLQWSRSNNWSDHPDIDDDDRVCDIIANRMTLEPGLNTKTDQEQKEKSATLTIKTETYLIEDSYHSRHRLLIFEMGTGKNPYQHASGPDVGEKSTPRSMALSKGQTLYVDDTMIDPDAPVLSTLRAWPKAIYEIRWGLVKKE